MVGMGSETHTLATMYACVNCTLQIFCKLSTLFSGVKYRKRANVSFAPSLTGMVTSKAMFLFPFCGSTARAFPSMTIPVMMTWPDEDMVGVKEGR